MMNSTHRALGLVTLFCSLFASADPVLCGEGNPLGTCLNAAYPQGSAPVVQVIVDTLDAYGNGTQASIEAELKPMGDGYETAAKEKFLTTRRARGGVLKDTGFVDVNFAGNGQMQSRTHAFTVQDGGIIV